MANKPRNQAAPASAVDYSAGAAIRQNVISATLQAMAEGMQVTETQVAAPTAVELAQTAVDQIQAALAILGEAHAATPAMRVELDAALAALASEQAAAALDSKRLSEIEQVTALAAALPEGMLDKMLAAIAEKYAPAAEPTPEAAPAVAEAAPAPTGIKQPGVNTLARNAAVAEALVTDPELVARADAAIDAYYASDHKFLFGVRQLANTRFAGIASVPSSGAGVANHADFVILTTAVRLRLGERYPKMVDANNGKAACDMPWMTSTGSHAVGGKKDNDGLRTKFTDGRALALYPDGRFRLALPGTAGVRFTHLDGAALNAYAKGAAAAPAAALPETSNKPTPPTEAQLAAAAAAASASAASGVTVGVLTKVARCQHCSERNVVGEALCANERCADRATWYLA